MSTRRVHRIQTASAVADGAVLTTVVLYFTQVVGLAAGAVGLVLAAAAAASVALATPLGRLADRVGLARTAAGSSLGVAAALAAYAVVDSLWSYAVAGVLFGVARSGLSATIQAIVAAQTPPEQRVRARARLHTLLNAGFGVGAVLGAAVLAADRASLFSALFAAGAVTALVCAAAFLRLPPVEPVPAAAPVGRHGALRDRRLVTVTGLASILQLTMPVLSVLLPLWIAHAGAPMWLAATGFGLNTVLVFALQSPWSAWVRTDADAARSAIVAGTTIGLAAVLFAVVPAVSAAAAIGVVLVGVVALTVGEVATGPAAWHLALRDVPADRHGEYQSVFGMSFSGARVIGPLVALPLITHQGALGWLVLAGVVLAAGLTLATVRGERSTCAATAVATC
jgi:MFS family permease